MQSFTSKFIDSSNVYGNFAVSCEGYDKPMLIHPMTYLVTSIHCECKCINGKIDAIEKMLNFKA